MDTLLGCAVDSCTDTSVILHTLSWNFEIDPFSFFLLFFLSQALYQQGAE